MIDHWQSDSTIVDCVRIRSGSGDFLAVQQRIGNLLRNATLRPSRLPSSAILCVRRLSDPLPRTDWLSPEALVLPSEWEDAATLALDRLASVAARPILAHVPASAQAVLFADRAELLACLAVDWLHGTLRSNWWWKTFLKQGDSDLVVEREWLQFPEFLPATFELLVIRSRALEFLRRLPANVAATLLARMLQVHGIPEVIHRAEIWPEDSHSNSEPGSEPSSVSIAGNDPGVEPWYEWVPEACNIDLSIIDQTLLAQALMLRRAPAQSRLLSFQRKIAEWQMWTAKRRLSAQQTSEVDTPAEKTNTVDDDQIGLPRLHSASSVVNAMTTTGCYSDTAPNTQLVTAKDPDAVPMGTKLQSSADVPSGPALVGVSVTTVHSAFGGVFFLLNVALYLELYGDFASPLKPGLPLDIWDFIFVLALEILGNDMKEDPIHDLLASLAGRSKSEAPARYFTPPEEWHLPSEWLKPFPEIFEWNQTVRDGRVQVVHPAGFLLLDKGEIKEPDATDTLSRWLNWIVGYIRARLVRALARDDAAEFLCRLPSRIAITPTRVDVFFSLDLYPVEIRLAGLDRDPGWIPAAGRVVAFHFE